MDCLKSEINYLVMAGWLPRDKANRALTIARRFLPSKGEDQICDKLGELAQTNTRIINPLGYMTNALKALPNRSEAKEPWDISEEERQRLIGLARTKWTDEGE